MVQFANLTVISAATDNTWIQQGLLMPGSWFESIKSHC